jgi:phosphomannomutase
MADLTRIFKAYDVRGIVPDELDERVARAVGTAFARFAGAKRILVGRDMRTSSPALAAAFVAGVTATGTDAVDLGLVSTDLLYFAAGRLDAPGAVFTASHNPPSYNGIKLCLAGARPVGRDTGLEEVRRLAEAALEAPLAPASPPGRVEQLDLLEEYAVHVRSFVRVDRLRPLLVVADVANGMGALVVPKVFEGLPVRVEVLFGELDGTFPNHPADPIQPENLADVRRAVLERGADIGLAFDGDADRVFFVDERAEPVSGSLITALVAQAMLERHPGATILYNLICSKVVPETIEAAGGVPVRTRVGHSYIKQVMADTGAVFAGEHSGHYYFRDNYRADSGIVAALVVLEILSVSGQRFSDLLAPYRRYAASGERNTPVQDPDAVVDALAAEMERLGARCDRLDGLTADFGSWWFNARPSNTEPLLRVNVEAATEAECEERTAWVLEQVARLAGRHHDAAQVSVASDSMPSGIGGAPTARGSRS